MQFFISIPALRCFGISLRVLLWESAMIPKNLIHGWVAMDRLPDLYMWHGVRVGHEGLALARDGGSLNGRRETSVRCDSITQRQLSAVQRSTAGAALMDTYALVWQSNSSPQQKTSTNSPPVWWSHGQPSTWIFSPTQPCSDSTVLRKWS